MLSPDAAFVRIALVNNEIEAGLLDAVLVEREVPHIMQSYYDAAYDGLFQLQKGWGCVNAPEACRDTVLSLLEELRNARTED